MTTSDVALTAVDPRSGAALSIYDETAAADVPALVDAALRAFADTALQDPDRRAAGLWGTAEALRDAADELCPLVAAESGLPDARVAGELERMCVQIELFARVVERGDHLEVIIDPADPQARPVPRPDLRRMLVPIGPVAVFGASNFPLAFGVAGGDTASALAAGCPVIVKGHPSQPGVNELVGHRVAGALAAAGLPPGTFAIVQGSGPELGEALVDADGIAAVGFTGSLAGGRALFDLAARRPRPIPVYAEMGSVNPVVLTAAAIFARAGEIRDALVTAVTFAAGQLCTKPGVVFVPAGDGGDAFVASLARALQEAEPPVMLNERLHEGFAQSVDELRRQPGVELLAGAGTPDTPGFRHAPVVLTVDAGALASRPELREECFGPAIIVARHRGEEELLTALAAFDGQLAASVFAEPGADDALTGRLAALLTARVGRLAFDLPPTGAQVTWAMHHGGPYPATTTPDHTSVGQTATRRFMRPVCWQNAPRHVLPEALRDENPRGVWRRIDGDLTDGPVPR